VSDVDGSASNSGKSHNGRQRVNRAKVMSVFDLSRISSAIVSKRSKTCEMYNNSLMEQCRPQIWCSLIDVHLSYCGSVLSL